MTKRDQWFSLVAEQEQSGTSIISFCNARHLKLSTFHYWRKKFKQVEASQKGFVDITPSATLHTAIRISYPGGVDVHLSSADISLITRLIALA
jgi:hypothetical protein